MPVFTPSSDTLRLYECIVLLKPDLPEREEREAIASVEQLFTEKGGKQLAKDSWGKHGLAFEIEGHREGQYLVFVYEVSPEETRDIDTGLHLEKGVLRHLLVRLPKGEDVTTFAERQALAEKEREVEEQKKEHEKEETVRQKVIQRAARAAPAKTPAPTAESAAPTGSLEEKLTELIAGEDLHL